VTRRRWSHVPVADKRDLGYLWLAISPPRSFTRHCQSEHQDSRPGRSPRCRCISTTVSAVTTIPTMSNPINPLVWSTRNPNASLLSHSLFSSLYRPPSLEVLASQSSTSCCFRSPRSPSSIWGAPPCFLQHLRGVGHPGVLSVQGIEPILFVAVHHSSRSFVHLRPSSVS
jgi:hypothetical protein